MNNVMFHLQNITEQIIGFHNDGARAGGEASPHKNQINYKNRTWLRVSVATEAAGRRRGDNCWCMASCGAGHSLQSLRYTLLTSADAMAWIFRPKVHQKRLVETWMDGVPGPVGRSPGNIDIVTPLAWVLWLPSMHPCTLQWSNIITVTTHKICIWTH